MPGPSMLRATWAFRNLAEGYGWSETLWSRAPVTVDGLVPEARKYATLRAQLLAQNVVVDEIRISDDNFLRDSELAEPPDPIVPADGNVYYNPVNQALTACPIDVSINYRLECTQKYRGPLFLGGAPNQVTGQIVSNSAVNPAYQKLLDNFTNYLKKNSSQWCLKVLNKEGDGAPLVPISLVTFVGQTPTITALGHGLSTGDFVRVTNVKMLFARFSCSNLAIVVTNPNAFTIVGYKGSTLGTYQGGGFVQKLVPILTQITDVIQRGVTHRKRGRFFGQRRGRA